MESINMFFIVVLAAVANGHVIQRPLEINNEHNQPIRVIVNNGTRVTLRNIGRENFSVNGRRFVPLRPVRPVTTTTPEPEPPIEVVVEPPASNGGITVAGQNLLAGQQYVVRQNALGGLTLVPVVNSESVVGGANLVAGGNLVDGVGRIDGVSVVTPNNCCEERTVLRTVCNNPGGGCSLVRQRVCLRKCVPDDAVVVGN